MSLVLQWHVMYLENLFPFFSSFTPNYSFFFNPFSPRNHLHYQMMEARAHMQSSVTLTEHAVWAWEFTAFCSGRQSNPPKSQPPPSLPPSASQKTSGRALGSAPVLQPSHLGPGSSLLWGEEISFPGGFPVKRAGSRLGSEPGTGISLCCCDFHAVPCWGSPWALGQPRGC